MKKLPKWTNYIFKSCKWAIKSKSERRAFYHELKDVFSKYPEKDNWYHEANELSDIIDNMFQSW